MTTTLNASTAGAGGFIATSDNSGVLALQTGGTTAITVDTSANVGIGTTSPTSAGPRKTLTVNGASGADFYLQYGGTEVLAIQATSATAPTINYPASGSLAFQNGTERMRIDSSGNLLVGTTTNLNASKIAVVTSGSYLNGIEVRTAGNNNAMTFYSNGSTYAGAIALSGSGTSYITSSDYRLKESIAPMTGALNKVAQLKPVTYKWKANGSDGQGFIAHELQEVVPDCVVGDKDAVDAEGNPQYQGIDVSFLVATLTAAIQELKSINDTQAETINALTARIVALEQKGTV